jgi:hypothetical protein
MLMICGRLITSLQQRSEIGMKRQLENRRCCGVFGLMLGNK